MYLFYYGVFVGGGGGLCVCGVHVCVCVCVCVCEGLCLAVSLLEKFNL